MEDKNNINNNSKEDVVPYTYSDMNEGNDINEIKELEPFSFKKLFYKDLKFFSFVLFLISIVIFLDLRIIYINS